MAVEINHVIFRAKDKWASARFLAGILGIEAGPEWGRFVPVRVANGVTLDFADTPEPAPQHFAFLVSDAEFDRLVRHVYKVLMTRGMVGTLLYSTDEETRELLRTLIP